MGKGGGIFPVAQGVSYTGWSNKYGPRDRHNGSRAFQQELTPVPLLTKGDSMFKTASLQFGAYIEFVPTIYAYQKEACHVDATYASSL